MFFAHGIFGILTIDHRRDVGLAPCGAGLSACARRSLRVCRRMADFKIGGVAAKSSSPRGVPCGRRDGVQTL